MSEELHADRRVQKTVLALREAFFDLVLSYSYDEIKVADILEKANVGRSTFYQHYKNKDQLLAASMDKLLTVLAQSADENMDEEALFWLMEHFWENRAFAPRIFAGTARRVVIQSLSDKIATHIRQRINNKNQNSSLSVSITAHQLAEAQMTPIIDWLLGMGQCSAESMAKHIKNTSCALMTVFLY